MPKRALVTGASRGIGAAIARRLAADGFFVFINYRSQHAAAQAVKIDIEKTGGQADLCPFDVTDKETSAQAIEGLLAQGPISVLVNNAGILADTNFPSMTRDQWESVTRTSIDGFYNVTHPMVMPMVRQKYGRIISISSVSGLSGNKGQVNYAAAKAALVGATKALAIELARRKITVNAVAPGLIETDMIQDLPDFVVKQMIAARRVGKPEEVADLVGFLASEQAAYITGQVIRIDGGLR